MGTPDTISDAAMRPFRVIVSDGGTVTNLVVSLALTPAVGDTLTLPNGEQVAVSHVISSSRDGLAGIVHAEPA